MTERRAWRIAQFRELPAWVLAQLPESRLTLHRQAIDLLLKHEAFGEPFVLMLKTYGATQVFAKSQTDLGDQLENVVLDALAEAGVGLIQVQSDEGVSAEFYRPETRHLRVRAPSLYLASAGWLQEVTFLIERAECIIVLLSLATPGVVQELETILALGRADRTVVLVTGEEAGGEIDGTVLVFGPGHEPDDLSQVWETPILRSFPRVLWVGDLFRPAPLQTFVVRDLVERLTSIRALDWRERRELVHGGMLDHTFPVTWRDTRREFQQLAIASRAACRLQFAAHYFRSVSMLAMMDGDVLDAIEATIDQASLLLRKERHLQAEAAVSMLIASIDAARPERWIHDAAFVLAHARLVAERARTLIPAGALDEAVRILSDERGRCQTPLNRRALSTLDTMTAWVLRATTDVDGVLRIATTALELAVADKAPWEMARALTVLGATFDDLGQLTAAESALRKAAAIIERDWHPEDGWLIRMRLATVFEHAGRLDEARSVLEDAVRVADRDGLRSWAGTAEHRIAKLAAATTADMDAGPA